MEVQEAAVAALEAALAAAVLEAAVSVEAHVPAVDLEAHVPEVLEARVPEVSAVRTIIRIITVPISVGDSVRAAFTAEAEVARAQ